jgi:Cytochrome b(C-terminal)/b6/petD
MHTSPEEFIQGIAPFLGLFYLALALMNAGAGLYLWLGLNQPRKALFWTLVAGFFMILSPLSLGGDAPYIPGVPESIKAAIDQAAGPVTYTLGTTGILAALFLGRKFFVQPTVAWSLLNLSLFAMGCSMKDQDFAAIMTKPDNVPIVGLVYLLGFFTWLATKKAVENDERIAAGKPPLEKELDEKVLVWPDLVYTELICMVALTALLLLWAIVLKAPLEEPATSVKTPNPSKAPWYFLGLQEMLVYFDPWMAGVVMPGTVVFGLMAIPYIDFNKKGNGYYTINERKFAYVIFQIGFLELWITLIILGTFLRGPNWNFFGPFEYWDTHKVLALNNVDLSQYFWVQLLSRELPRAPAGALESMPFWKAFAVQTFYILYREAPGFLLLGGYFLLLPPLLAKSVFKSFFVKMGLVRYMLMSNLLLMMAILPIKMALRWTINLKYFIHIDEWFLNF